MIVSRGFFWKRAETDWWTERRRWSFKGTLRGLRQRTRGLPMLLFTPRPESNKKWRICSFTISKQGADSKNQPPEKTLLATRNIFAPLDRMVSMMLIQLHRVSTLFLLLKVTACFCFLLYFRRPLSAGLFVYSISGWSRKRRCSLLYFFIRENRLYPSG